MIYYVIGIEIFLFYIINNYTKTRILSEKVLAVIAILEMIVLAGLRSYEVGNDTLAYVQSFQSYAQYGNYGIGERFEPGYQALTRIVTVINKDPRVFILITSIIIYMGFYIFIKWNSNSVLLSVLIFYLIFFCNSLNVSRQYLAAVIAVNCIDFIKDKKYIKALIIIFVAGMFHVTALIYLSVVFAGITRKNNKWILAFLGVSAVFLVFSNQVISVLLKLFPSYGFYFRMQIYQNSGEIGKLTLLMLGFTITAVFMIFNKKSNRAYDITTFSLDDGLIIETKIMIMACAVGILASRYLMINRVAEMLNIFIILLIPNILGRLNAKVRFISEIVIVFILGIYMYTVINYGNIGVYPYKFM
ncbi:transmembrane protein EpsG [Lachnospiraceae bacterium]|jgi:hypothetical protein|nr:transmembrane protein EpsG [Lachnospiraceae bacterium]